MYKDWGAGGGGGSSVMYNLTGGGARNTSQGESGATADVWPPKQGGIVKLATQYEDRITAYIDGTDGMYSSSSYGGAGGGGACSKSSTSSPGLYGGKG